MTNNEQPKLFIFLCYQDPIKAINLLVNAFGFEKLVRYPDEEKGGIAHAELKLGEAIIMIQTDHEGYAKPQAKNGSTGYGAMITLASEQAIRDLYERAIKAGAISLVPPEATAWGNYRCELQDLEGFQWSFGTYVPGSSGW